MRLGLTDEEAVAGLRALKAVSLADGVFDQSERNLVRAAGSALSLVVDVDAVEPCEPEEAAAAITTPLHRERLVQSMLVCALIDGEASEKEAALIERFAAALGVDEPRLRNFESVASGHLRYVQFDLMRHSTMVSDVVREAFKQQGVSGAYRTLAPFAHEGLAIDEELAARYEALGELDEDTFGRAYFEHMKERGFSFPGQQRGFPEGFIKHDLCHVLGDYDTDPAGECEVIAFIAGFMERDPFAYLFMIVLHMHLGIEIFQGDATGDLAFDPQRALAALRRGSLVNQDLYATDFDWWEHLPQPLADVRHSLNVLPKDAVQV